MIYEEYLSFIKKYCGILNKVSELMGDKDYMYDDAWKNLSLSELKKYNYGIYEPLSQNSMILLDKSDEMHKYMSAVAYMLVTDYRDYVFNRDFYRIGKFKTFLYKFTAAVETDSESLAKKMIWDYVNENLKYSMDYSVKSLYTSNLLKDVILNCDLNKPNYLYLTGKYITDNEVKIVNYFNKISYSKIKAMAKTLVDGFLKGYKQQGLDFSIKDFVTIEYPIGFEKMVKEVYELLKDKTDVVFICNGNECNKNMDYFHRNDDSIYLTDAFAERKISLYKEALEKHKNMLCEYGGPLCIEVFGKKAPKPSDNFSYDNDNELLFDNNEQLTQLIYDVENQNYKMLKKYTNSKDNSYAMISYPCPDIGENFEAIFNDTVELNTLDSALYEKIQDKIINVLDTGEYVIVKGKNGNKTDIRINLTKLNNPKTETMFENCVADLNIPVGEVFTTPVLKGTEGLLHIPVAHLGGIKYTDLELQFKDGIVTDYNCKNFDDESKNKTLVRQYLLYNYETLPMSEFAIGTNTKAYLMAKKYKIENQLSELIAEKTGPHFAVGDTCYVYQENLRITNPNGKEVIAKENDYSMLRYTDADKAYFGTHTDITIPYNEIDYIKVVTKDNKEISIIENGLFVLSGTRQLNEPLYECKKQVD